jgi:hypothetical protein
MAPNPPPQIDLNTMFADTDAKTRLEALRIATTPQRLWAWAAICSAVGVGGLVLTALRFAILWRYGV